MPIDSSELVAAAMKSLQENPEPTPPPSPPPEPPPPPATPQWQLPTTDLGLAERLALRHGEDLRYCHPWKSWLIWDGCRWRADESGQIFRLAAETVRSIYAEVSQFEDKPARTARLKFAISSESRRAIAALEELARSLRGMAITVDELDPNPFLLNCRNGVIDLRTGLLGVPQRSAMITKLVPYDYDPLAVAERWDRFCYEIMAERDNLVSFLQRAVGYSITGDTTEKVLFLCHGATGNNGKTTFLETLRSVFGEYSGQVLIESLMVQKHANGGAATPDIADMRGLRLVTSSESEEGNRLAEAKIKYLTGMNRIKARRLHKDFWEFRPTCKLWMDLNHLPNIRGTDRAIWNRVRKIPFEMELEQDQINRGLMVELLQEAPGILRWAVDGAMQWATQGLGLPQEISAATEEYHSQMDVLGRFLEEATVKGLPSNEIGARQLYRVYCQWATSSGEFTVSERVFGERLTDRGVTKRHTRSGSQYCGLRLSDAVTEFTLREPATKSW